jgi:hypothetical protein
MTTAAELKEQLEDSSALTELGYGGLGNALNDYFDWSKAEPLELPVGTVTGESFSAGELDDRNTQAVVLTVTDSNGDVSYWRVDGYYDSWNGTEWEDDLYEVRPREVTRVLYERA